MNQLAVASAIQRVPALVIASGERAAYRFLEFFTAQIRNPHTRRAYVRAVSKFCAWLDVHGVPSITAVGSIHVATYVEALGRHHAAPTVKQRLAAIRMMFDWLATRGAAVQPGHRRTRPQARCEARENASVGSRGGPPASR